MTKKEFVNSLQPLITNENVNVAIEFNSKDGFMEFLEYLEKYTDIKWRDRKNPTFHKGIYGAHGTNTCLRICNNRITYADTAWYKREGYEIKLYSKSISDVEAIPIEANVVEITFEQMMRDA